MINNKVFKNAAWIIGCKIIQAILGLFVTMLSARYLGPSGYGLINYAASLVSFVSPIMLLGFDSILVQELINEPKREGEILGTAIITCFIASFFCVFGVISVSAVLNRNEIETVIVCALYSLLLIFQALNIIQYWFQAKLKSKYVSLVMLVVYILISIYQIILLIRGKGVRWFAVSKAFDYAIIALALFIIYTKAGGQKLSFSLKLIRRMFAKSKYYIISSLMVKIFAETDKIMLKTIIDDASTGYYSAAVTCVGTTSFIFAAILDSFRPVVLEAKKSSEEDFENYISLLYCIIIYLSLLQCIAMTLFAPLIVNILYGEQYSQAIGVLRLIVWYSTFSYIGPIRNIWLLAEGKQKYLWVINLSGAILNVILNFVLIPVWGMYGAAFASLLTQIFTNVIMSFIIKPIRGINKFLLKGLNIKLLFEFYKEKKRL